MAKTTKAIDPETGKEITIDEAVSGIRKWYKCKVCGNGLKAHKGAYRTHHFVHRTNKKCNDTKKK
jgi:competence CoiA-like predicted nuclease